MNRRATRIPLQYLTGSAPFLELELLVSPAVLIPRPETEGLALLASQRLAEFSGYGLCRVLDFATGSGCLALYLARHHPEVEIHALDLSLPALDIARENARRLNLTSNIHFHHGDGFGAFCDGNGILPTDLRFDLLVSNPPYIPSHEVDELAPEVRRHEPRLALDGGSDGLNFYRRLIQEAPAWLNPGAWFLAEFGDDQANELQTLFARTPWTRVTIVPDLGGRDRILAVQYQP